MASAFALTEDGDLDFSTGNLRLEDDRVERATAKTRKAFALWQGSWFLDINAGFPYLQQILGQKPRDLTAIGGLFRATALSVPDVVSTQLDVAYDGSSRELTVAFESKLSDGSIAEGEVVL